MSDVSDIIWAQLGGNKFKAMTGAIFMGDENSLSVLLPNNFATGGINQCKIILMPSDTYRVEFSIVSPDADAPVRTVDTREDIYAENLREVFERVTGLRTSL